MARNFISDIIAKDYPLFYAFDFDKETSPKQAVFLAKDGIYERSQQSHFDLLYRTQEVESRGGNGEISPYVDPVPEMPKVPLKIMATIFAFFRQIYEKARTEVQINVYWNRDHKEIPDVPGMMAWGNDLYTYVPKQTVSSTRTTFDKDDTYLWMIKNTIIVLDTHSHHDMNAFMSGTDQASSNIPAVYLDLGRITSDNAQIFAWCAIDDRHIFENLPLSELYKFMEALPEPKEPEIKQWSHATNSWIVKPRKLELNSSTDHLFDSTELMKSAIEIPEDWQKQVTFPAPAAPYKFNRGFNNRNPYQTSLFDDDLNLIDLKMPSQWKSFDLMNEGTMLSETGLTKEESLEDMMNWIDSEVSESSRVKAIIELNQETTTKYDHEDWHNIVDVEEIQKIGYYDIPLTECNIIGIYSPISLAPSIFENEIATGAISTLADINDSQYELIKKINRYAEADQYEIMGELLWPEIIDVFGVQHEFLLEISLVVGDLDIWIPSTPEGRTHKMKSNHKPISHKLFDTLKIKVSMSEGLINNLNLRTAFKA